MPGGAPLLAASSLPWSRRSSRWASVSSSTDVPTFCRRRSLGFVLLLPVLLPLVLPLVLLPEFPVLLLLLFPYCAEAGVQQRKPAVKRQATRMCPVFRMMFTQWHGRPAHASQKMRAWAARPCHGSALLVPQRFDRVHARRHHGGVQAEADADHAADDEAADHRPLGHARRVVLVAEAVHYPRQELSEADTD